jgi:hypothetical protein
MVDYVDDLPSIYCTYTAGGGDTALTVSSAAFTHACDNITLTQQHSLAVNSCVVESAASTPTLSTSGATYTLQITGEAKVA